MASLSKSQAQKIASEVGGTVRSSANGGYKVEYQVRGNGTKSTRYIIRPDQAPNLTPHARETNNASDPANKAAQNAVRTGTAIADIGTFTPNSLSPVKPLNLPTPPPPGNPGDVVGSNNSSLVGGLAGQGYSLDGKGQFSYSAPAQGNGFEDIFKSYLGNQEAPPSLSSIYDKLEKDNKIRQKEAAVQSYTNQINSITSKAQAESLALEGQGRGITESIIGGQQAKINREAAIQALPIQAQLAAATGDLESARNFVAQKFQLLAQDAQAQYQYKQRLVDAVYNFANAQQQRQLDALQKKEDQAFQLRLKNLDFQQQKELLSYKAGLESSSTGLTLNQGPQMSFQEYLKTRENELLQNVEPSSKLYKQIQDEYSQLGQQSNVGSALVNAFNNVSAGVAPLKQKQVQGVFQNYLNNGDIQGAKDYLTQIAVSNLPADQQNQSIGRAQAIQALDDIEALLQEANANGASTNILSGNITNIAEKLGATNDPRFSYISGRILSVLQTYRRAMTGVAFSPAESAQYERLFPGTTKTGELNTAKLSALRDSLNANNRTVLAFFMGGSNYDALYGKQETNTYTGSTGTLEGEDIYNSVLGGQSGSSQTQDWASFLNQLFVGY